MDECLKSSTDSNESDDEQQDGIGWRSSDQPDPKLYVDAFGTNNNSTDEHNVVTMHLEETHTTSTAAAPVNGNGSWEPRCANWKNGCQCTSRSPGFDYCFATCGRGEVCMNDYHPSKQVAKSRLNEMNIHSGLPPSKVHSSAKPKTIMHRGRVN